MLKPGDFEALLTNNPGITHVFFDCFGEVFLNPHLPEMLDHATTAGVTMEFGSANFNTVSKDMLEALVKSGVRSLTCAIDAATPDTYKKYRLRGDFNRVITNIRELNRLKQVHGSPYPRLTWLYVVFGHNEGEIAAARQMAKDLNMSFQGKMAWDSNYSPVRDKEAVRRQLGWEEVNREGYLERTKRHYAADVCLGLWRAPFVNWDGRVFGCCWNTDVDFGGNVFRDGYLAAINNDRISYARKMLMGLVEPREDTRCTRCEIYAVMKKHASFITRKEVRPFLPRSLGYRAARFVYRRSGLRDLRQWLARNRGVE